MKNLQPIIDSIEATFRDYLPPGSDAHDRFMDAFLNRPYPDKESSTLEDVPKPSRGSVYEALRDFGVLIAEDPLSLHTDPTPCDDKCPLCNLKDRSTRIPHSSGAAAYSQSQRHDRVMADWMETLQTDPCSSHPVDWPRPWIRTKRAGSFSGYITVVDGPITATMTYTSSDPVTKIDLRPLMAEIDHQRRNNHPDNG